MIKNAFVLLFMLSILPLWLLIMLICFPCHYKGGKQDNDDWLYSD